ncbi:iron complex outermembrane receptor protein [Idiomarina aquatica]|uniref:Iron complex outermembrane receptor protein n=1 Tax=Idiomarina aquatica TaxID=1327752 RepID=A0A4R6PM95_9GAMM|nr:TonB-dependent receptor [Idiomarina aquatica]TDP38940.1 iron complex outermembrane receptor protein [Idiomarina aquatica]
MRLNAITLGLLGMTTLPVAAQQSSQSESVPVGETIVITANPLNKTALESTQPVSIISGDELQQKHAQTLGETLSSEPGINNTHYTAGAGSPIIRGLDGPRVKITQNGLDTGDVSRGSPDHAVTTETSSAEQIEVLRGPATLLYGSGAIGGVINVVDNRIPTQPVYDLEGNLNLRGATVNDQKEASYNFTAGNGSWAFYADAHYRRSDDFDTPNFINDEGEAVDSVENSFSDSDGATLGTAYHDDWGFFGVSYQALYSEYGIPGHAHGHDEEHEDEHGEEEHEEDHGAEEEALPFADLEQQRWQIAGQLNAPVNGIEAVEMRAAFTDYQHREIEGAQVGTQFNNNQKELRVIAKHEPLQGWSGALGYQWDISDKQAFGAEAFTPDTSRRAQGVFWLVEQEFGDHHVDLGARYEQTTLASEDVRLDTFDSVSSSAGYLYHFDQHSSVSVNLSHAERAPSATEVFANGEHFATQTYELGTFYELHQEDNGEYHIENAGAEVSTETSNNIDVGLHFENERVHAQVNVFYNRVDNFIYERFTGISSDMIHTDEGHDEHAGELADEHGHEGEEALEVVQFAQADAELYGYELDLGYRFDDAWSLHGFSDYTRAKQTAGGDLPRIPAQRIGIEARYQAQDFDAAVGYTRYMEQDRIADNETVTPAFGIVDARINYYPQMLAQYGATVYLKGENLTDQLGLVHSSFLKDDVPMPGRNVQLGVSINF